MLSWTPPNSNRGRGHPNKPWVDDLDPFFYSTEGLQKGGWQQVAQDRIKWQSYENAFVKQIWYR
eukprot:875572-Karenia_brevis.AAC.1